MYHISETIKGIRPGEAVVMRGQVVIAFDLPIDIAQNLADQMNERAES